jgi:S-ribosylhomocysteine lyase LuxS involved in autoinducer biosynthesis
VLDDFTTAKPYTDKHADETFERVRLHLLQMAPDKTAPWPDSPALADAKIAAYDFRRNQPAQAMIAAAIVHAIESDRAWLCEWMRDRMRLTGE